MHRSRTQKLSTQPVFVPVVQSGQHENPRGFDPFMDSPRSGAPTRSAWQNCRNLFNEIRREIGLVAVASMAFFGKICFVLVHQPHLHKWVSTSRLELPNHCRVHNSSIRPFFFPSASHFVIPLSNYEDLYGAEEIVCLVETIVEDRSWRHLKPWNSWNCLELDFWIPSDEFHCTVLFE